MATAPLTVLFAILLVAALGLFLVGFGVIAWTRPSAASLFLRGFAGSAPKHYVEMAVRLAFGWALVVASSSLTGSDWISAAGWVLLITTGLMLCLPWRLHRAFTERAVPQVPFVLRTMGLISFCGGAFLLSAIAGLGPQAVGSP